MPVSLVALDVNVPAAFVGPLVALSKLSDEAAERLTVELRKLPAFAPRRRMIEAIESAVGADVDPAMLSQAVTSLLMQFPDLPKEELARGVSQASELDLPHDRREKLANRLVDLLAVDVAAMIAKADGVITDHEHVFRSVRILTDVRAVFPDDPSRPPEAAVIVNMLRLDHFTDGRRGSFYVALDAADLLQLQKAVDRATAKTEALKTFLTSAGLTYFAHQEQPE